VSEAAAIPIDTRRRSEALSRGAPLHPPDYGLVLVIATLLCFGLIMVYSASVVTAYTTYHNQFYFLNRQVLSAVLGLVALLVLLRVDYHLLVGLALPGLIVCIGMLAAVLMPGVGAEAYGAQRWLRLPGFQLQPSEVAKLALTLYMACWLSTKREQVRDFAYGLVPFAMLLTLIVGLLLKQPDLGTAVVILATAVAIFFAAGAHLLQLTLLLGGTVVALVALIHVAPYRMQRLLTFLDPWSHPLASGYHVVQALLALGAGGVLGVGLGVGRQKFLYLPFPHTDSIFAVIGEELGFAGTAAVVALFVLFAFRGLRVAWYAPDLLGRLLATGISCGITFQALINMGVLTSSLPFTGITLPFVSYGGSSLIVTLASCGILLNISRQTVPRDDGHSTHPRHHFWRRYRRPHLSGAGRSQRAAS